MQFKSLAYFTSLIALVLGATVQDVVNDLTAVQAAVTALDNAVNSFPVSGGTLDQALAIHMDSTNLQSAIDATTADTQAFTPVPVSDADAQSVLNAVNANVPIILDCLSATIDKKPAFAAITTVDVPILVLQDLQSIAASNTALENALLALVPADFVNQANALIAKVDAAFTSVITAYES